MRVTSVQVGLPRNLAEADGASWTTAFGKLPVQGPCAVLEQGMAGDHQVNRKYHGGPDRAVLAYPAAHYPLWRAELSWPDLGPGGFGENLTIEGCREEDVCIGDVWRVGTARLEVSSPRTPCRSISRFWGREGLLRLVESSGRTGFYLRTLEAGQLEAGDAIVRLDRPHPWASVAGALRVRRRRVRERVAARALASIPQLAADWKEALLR